MASALGGWQKGGLQKDGLQKDGLWTPRGGRVLGLAGTLILHGLVVGTLFIVRPGLAPLSKPKPVEVDIWIPTEINPPPPLPMQAPRPDPPAPTVTRTIAPPVQPLPPSPELETLPFELPPPTSPPLAAVSTTPSLASSSTRSTAPAIPELRAGIDFNCPRLRYPQRARTLGEEGTVVLGLRLRHDGYLAAREVLGSSGSPRLDAAALNWVSRCSFSPPPGDAGTVEVLARLPVQFTLR